MASKWFVNIDGVERGPLPSAELRRLVSEGRLFPDTPVRPDGNGRWFSARDIKGLLPQKEPESRIDEDSILDALGPARSLSEEEMNLDGIESSFWQRSESHTAETSRRVATPIPSGYVCPVCDQVLPDDLTFCVKCGVSAVNISQIQEDKERVTRRVERDTPPGTLREFVVGAYDFREVCQQMVSLGGYSPWTILLVVAIFFVCILIVTGINVVIWGTEAAGDGISFAMAFLIIVPSVLTGIAIGLSVNFFTNIIVLAVSLRLSGKPLVTLREARQACLDVALFQALVSGASNLAVIGLPLFQEHIVGGDTQLLAYILLAGSLVALLFCLAAPAEIFENAFGLSKPLVIFITIFVQLGILVLLFFAVTIATLLLLGLIVI